MPETVLQQDAEKKRAKKGILGASEERSLFEKTLYLPYLDFTYQFLSEKGLFSKQSVLGRGRSVVMALREVDFGFAPELVAFAPQLVELESDSGSIVQGVGSTVLVSERLEELKKMLTEYDKELSRLSEEYKSMLKTGSTRQDLKDSIDHLKNTREERLKMFADGLKLPSKVDLKTLELLEGGLFYIPYFITKLYSRGESRFLVWDRHGKENESIEDELAKNRGFRELILSYGSA